MLLHGDELGRTQQGNNNGYAQDNELTWVDWENMDQPLVEFTAALSRLRRQHPTFRRRRFFDGRPVEDGAAADIVWLRPDGTRMRPEDWNSGFGRAIGVFLNGNGIRERDRRGEEIVDDHFLVLFNASEEPIEFHIPDVSPGRFLDVLVDTGGDHFDQGPIALGSSVVLAAKAVMVLVDHLDPEPDLDHSVAASLAHAMTEPIEIPGHAPLAEAGIAGADTEPPRQDGRGT